MQLRRQILSSLILFFGLTAKKISASDAQPSNEPLLSNSGHILTGANIPMATTFILRVIPNINAKDAIIVAKELFIDEARLKLLGINNFEQSDIWTRIIELLDTTNLLRRDLTSRAPDKLKFWEVVNKASESISDSDMARYIAFVSQMRKISFLHVDMDTLKLKCKKLYWLLQGHNWNLNMASLHKVPKLNDRAVQISSLFFVAKEKALENATERLNAEMTGLRKEKNKPNTLWQGKNRMLERAESTLKSRISTIRIELDAWSKIFTYLSSYGVYPEIIQGLFNWPVKLIKTWEVNYIIQSDLTCHHLNELKLILKKTLDSLDETKKKALTAISIPSSRNNYFLWYDYKSALGKVNAVLQESLQESLSTPTMEISL